MMDEQLFQDLLASVKEGGAILRGEAPPSRAFEIDPDDDRLEHDPRFLRHIEWARRSLREGQRISIEDLREELETNER
jgi:hypothetical protein